MLSGVLRETYMYRAWDVYDLAYMYCCWDETTVSRGSQEISSCLKKHLLTHLKNHKHVIAYSDACTRQNRNIKMSLMWLKLLADSDKLKIIDHKFLVSGHSYLPNDRNFGTIKSFSKQRSVFVAEDWYQIIQKARTKNPFRVYKMEQADFASTKQLEQVITNRKKNDNNCSVNWWLRFKKEEPYKIFYKETLNEDVSFYVINIMPSKKGRPPLFKSITLKKLHNNVLPVSANKKQNMMERLQFISPVYHSVYQSLIVGDNNEDIGPLEYVEPNVVENDKV
ncbi:hypothetical protein ILUMI_15721 [Ignelater luminosus]|uniref:DUF7869 domain-containing protein n=1 Tax=Ignelater luminosus TaxID=2038154 RepID=A0A8K0CU77_IGNLU|nr:hypothetical protein ILUMI_15721 [Ignelater luminosus]